MPAKRVLAVLAASAVLLSGVLALLATLVEADGIEADLAERSRQALAEAGLPTDVVSFSGRDADVRARTPREALLASAVVATVDGVRSVDVSEVATASPAQAERGLVAEAHRAATALLQRAVDDVLAEHPITFRPDSAALTRAGEDAVAEVAAVLADAPSDRRFEVGGHVARVLGSDREGAEELSHARAAAVAEELVNHGIPPQQVTSVGYGDTRPLSRLGTSAIDRRVEITVR